MFASFICSDSSTERKVMPVNIMSNINFNEPETPLVSLAPFDGNKLDASNNSDETMKIYLRFRPVSDKQIERPFSLSNGFSIIANPPEQSNNYKNLLHGYGKGYQKFSFSKVFHDDANQSLIFKETAKVLLDDFMNGNDRLLFTYGTTSSGKTFTMNGGKKNVGIIPRALYRLFKSTKLSNNPSLLPIDFSEICPIKKVDVQKILNEKSALLKISEKETSDILNIFEDTDFNNSENVLINDNENSNSVDTYETTFWISYTEIYNEFIYDLLDPNAVSTLVSNNNKLKRPILDIRSARNGGSYIRGLKTYPAYSAEEAYRLLLVGRRGQSMGATKLNQNSSRSHTILTVRAVRTMPGSEYISKVCNLSFCDLAGSERTDKAQTSGISQKEAANINTSLLALGRCIDVIRLNQNNPNSQRVVPYRDSKLTRLFQTYLGGNGKASMIVCVNQDPNLFDESLQVLKFSALARKVVLHEKEKPEPKFQKKKERLSMYRRLGMNTPNKDRNTTSSILNEDTDFEMDETLEYEDSEEEMEEEYDVKELLDIIEKLKTELIATRKEKVANEARLRETINNDWSKTIMEMERDNARNVERLRNQMEEDLKIHTRNARNKAFMQLKKRKLQAEFVDSEDSDQIEEEENTIKQLNYRLECKNKELVDLQTRLKDAEEESADALEQVELMSQQHEINEAHCRELEFQISYLRQGRLTTEHSILLAKCDVGIQTITSDECVVIDELSATIDCDNDNISNLTAPHRSIRQRFNDGNTFNRFSTISTNPIISHQSALSTNQNTSLSTSTNQKSFFGPVNTPAKINEANNSEHQKSHKSLFKIYVDDDESDFSFLKREEECKQEEMDRMDRELCEKTVIIKQQKQQLQSLETEVQLLTDKLISREKSVVKLTDRQTNISIKLDNLISQLGITSVINNDNGMRVKEKLKVIARGLSQIQIVFDALNTIIPPAITNVMTSSTIDMTSSTTIDKEILKDCTNIQKSSSLAESVDTNHIIAHINQLHHQLQMITDDYQQLINICNEWIVDQSRSHLKLKIKRITLDTPLNDIYSRFQSFWTCAMDKVESLTNLTNQIRLTDDNDNNNNTANIINNDVTTILLTNNNDTQQDSKLEHQKKDKKY